jgi:actin-related protein 2
MAAPRPRLTRRLNVAGRHISAYLLELPQRRDHAVDRADLDAMRAAKERMCDVAADFADEARVVRKTVWLAESYTLPNMDQ